VQGCAKNVRTTNTLHMDYYMIVSEHMQPQQY